VTLQHLAKRCRQQLATLHCQSLDVTADGPTLKTVTVEQQKEETDCKVFRSVYNMQNSRPYLDLPGLIDLQVLNGLKLGRILHGNLSATNISEHIARKMRHKL
jgi:hypothetical protein